MSLRPYVQTEVNNTLVNIQNARTTVTIGMVAPTANTLASDVVHEFTDPDTAINIVGADTSRGNISAKLITDIFAQTSKVLIKFVSAGTNADSSTTTDLDGATSVGDKTITLTAGTGITAGDYVTIGTGVTQEYRRVEAVSSNDITVYPLDFKHDDAEAVTKITQHSSANLATARTALEDEEFRLYIEDAYGTQTAVETFMSARKTNQLFTQAIQGVDSGETVEEAKTLVNAVDESKYLIYVFGMGKDKKEGVTHDGSNVTANKILAKYAKKMSQTSDDNSILFSLNSLAMEELTDVRSNTNGGIITQEIADDLVDNNVSTFLSKRVASVNAVRVHKIVTTYTNDGTFNDTTYSNIADINGEIYIRNDLSDQIDSFLSENIASNPPKPITTGNIERLRAFVQQVVSNYTFLDLDSETSGFEPLINVTSPSAGQAQIDLTYKLQESIDQVTISLFKSVR